VIDQVDIAAELRGLEGDKVPFHVPSTRIGKIMEKDFASAKKRLHDRGFNDHFIWHFIRRSEVPSRKTIKNHLSNFGIDTNCKTPEIMYLHLRWIFFYLIQLMQGLASIHREDNEFARKLGTEWAQISKNFKDSREDFYLHGYLVGRASKYINDPDAWVAAIAAKQSEMASKAGKGNKGKIRSPASKAILLAFEHGHTTGKEVRKFFNECPIFDEIDVDIELNDEGPERLYRFCGLDESKDTELSEKAIDVRVSQLKRKFLNNS